MACKYLRLPVNPIRLNETFLCSRHSSRATDSRKASASPILLCAVALRSHCINIIVNTFESEKDEWERKLVQHEHACFQQQNPKACGIVTLVPVHSRGTERHSSTTGMCCFPWVSRGTSIPPPETRLLAAEEINRAYGTQSFILVHSEGPRQRQQGGNPGLGSPPPARPRARAPPFPPLAGAPEPAARAREGKRRCQAGRGPAAPAASHRPGPSPGLHSSRLRGAAGLGWEGGEAAGA